MVTGTADARPLCDSGLVTEPEPTPVFRRFPWVQLVFCLACLGMATWTWMRYSYCWSMSQDYVFQHSTTIEKKAWPHGAFVVVRGTRLAGGVQARVAYEPNVCVDRADWEMGCWFNLLPLDLEGSEPFVLEEVSVVGRVDEEGACMTRHIGSLAYMNPRILLGASRLTGASVAGLVVGAMGCFILGLYLRGWLRERKALASQPGQDMIA